MSQLFYKYLVDELITDYFATQKPEAGMKYYVLFEKREHRDGLYEALSTSASAKPITVTGIFENRQEWMDVDVYDTCQFCPNSDGVSIIVGNESETDNGYLTTLRNAVANPNSNYGKYALLNILSNNKLESITTAGINLLDAGGPLHQDEILKNVLDKLEHVSILAYDKLCLGYYAENIKERIEQKEADLFIFQDLLSVLQSGTVNMAGMYNKFGYFPDRYCTDAGLIPIEDKEIKKRIIDNSVHFARIKNILNSYSTEVFNELTKIYDNSLSNKIVKRPTDWFNIDYQDICDSVKKKSEQANYKFVSLHLSDSHNAELIHSALPLLSQKSKKVYVLVCDNTNFTSTQVIVDFNKKISDCCVLKELTYKGALQTAYSFGVNGSSLRIDLKDRPVKCDIGKGNNKFTFYFLRIKAASGTFEFIKPYFTITAKANINIKAPEDIDVITIGNGEKKIDFTDSLDDIVWNNDYIIKIDLNEYSEGINLPIVFSDKKVLFNIEVDEKRVVPVKIPKLIGEVWGTGKSATYPGGNKGRIGSNEYNIEGRFFKYIELERRMAAEKIYYMKKTTTMFVSSFEPMSIPLPAIVKQKLDAIYDYYTANGYAPSLAYIDEDLYKLYKAYLEAVHFEVSSIKQGSILTEQQYSLTKLGTIDDGDKVMLTPYHPLLVAYMMEFKNRYQGDKFDNPKVLKLVSPFYLMPYISYDNINRQPFCDEFTQDIKTWLFYETASNAQQVRTYNITTKMVIGKVQEFKKYFKYLFQVPDSPIILSTIGIYDDTNVVKGLFELVKNEMKSSYETIQRIEVHEYVKNLSQETFFEKLNRLNSEELICNELEKVGTTLDMGNKDISPLQVIRQFFTRIDFYKHDIESCGNQIDYCHIAFYQMETGLEFTKSPTSILRTELSLDGLISIPSTRNQGGKYTVGFGTAGMPSDISKYGNIYNIAIDMNSLYANERTYWANSYSTNNCFAKTYVFQDDILLQSIYERANWVTFINPEVDIDFFYRQKDLYVIHYTDQYTINAKYDSITVTKQTKQYDNMLSCYSDSYIIDPHLKDQFRQKMMNYFNSLNGDWLLSMINKTDVQVREKLSIVSACIMMRKFLSRNEDVLWIPISLEEILRVTGNIGLEQDSLFSKKTLGVKGQMSDDLLMVGVEKVNDDIVLYFYPVEVKASTGSSFVHTASEQVLSTYKVLKDTLLVNGGFVNDVYRTFFASQVLTNTDKLWANGLISEEEFLFINDCRFRLLNMDFTISKNMKCKEMGCAATVSFVGSSAPNACVEMVNDELPICHINVSLDTCNACICNDDVSSINQLLTSPIIVNDAVREFWKKQDNEIVTSSNDSDALITVQTAQNFESQSDEVMGYYEVGTSMIVKDNTKSMQDYSDNVNNEDTPTAAEEGVNYVCKNDIIENIKSNSDQSDQEEDADVPGIKITLGYSKINHEPVIFEPNNTRLVSHFNMGIIGTMGTGKTQLARSIIAQFSKEGIHNVDGRPIGMLVFDYKGDYKDQKFLDSVSGHVYRNKLPFNPLKLIVNDDVMDMNLPAITADRVSDSLAKAYGLGLKQQNNIKQTIVDAYEEVGITEESSTWKINPPTMKRVIDLYLDTYDANDKAFALLSNLRDYNVFTPNNENCISILEWLDSVRVFDLTIYSDETKRVVVSLLLDLFFAEMKQLGESKQENGFREIRSMILVDEAKEFMSKDFQSLRGIISQGRMFGVGMILATQYVDDFRTQKEDYSQSILSWMIHHVNSISKPELSSIFGASDSNMERYMDFINKAKLFECVCKVGSRVEGIRDLPFFELVVDDKRFSTDA